MSNITAILPNPDKKGSFDIYADGELIMTATEDAVIEAGLRTGMPFDEDALYAARHSLTLTRAKHKAYNYLSYGDMSEKKLFEKLTRAGFENDIAEECVAALKAQGFVDNARYALSLARNMADSKLYGLRRIESELKMRGISADDIDYAVGELETDFYENIRTLLGGRFKRDLTDPKAVSSVVRSLMRYGYDYEDIRSALRDVVSEDEYE